MNEREAVVRINYDDQLDDVFWAAIAAVKKLGVDALVDDVTPSDRDCCYVEYRVSLGKQTESLTGGPQ